MIFACISYVFIAIVESEFLLHLQNALRSSWLSHEMSRFTINSARYVCFALYEEERLRGMKEEEEQEVNANMWSKHGIFSVIRDRQSPSIPIGFSLYTKLDGDSQANILIHH